MDTSIFHKLTSKSGQIYHPEKYRQNYLNISEIVLSKSMPLADPGGGGSGGPSPSPDLQIWRPQLYNFEAQHTI